MNIENAEILVDSNPGENTLAALLLERGARVQRAALKTGDIAIKHDGWTVLIERKSVNDLAAGIAHPSRFIHSQRARLAGEVLENDKTIALVLINGVRPPCDSTFVGRSTIKGSTWHSVVQTTQLPPYRLPVLHSNVLEGAADNIVLLAKNLLNGKFGRGGLIDVDSKPPPCLKRKRATDTPTEILVAMLSSIPNCGTTKARALVSAFPTLSAILAASENEIAEIKIAGRKFGPSLAKRVKSVVC